MRTHATQTSSVYRSTTAPATATIYGIPRPFVMNTAAFVVTWGGADLVAEPLLAVVGDEPVEIGVSPAGIDMVPVTVKRDESVMIETTDPVSRGGIDMIPVTVESEGSIAVTTDPVSTGGIDIMPVTVEREGSMAVTTDSDTGGMLILLSDGPSQVSLNATTEFGDCT